MSADPPVPPFAYSAHEGRHGEVFAVYPSLAEATPALAQHQRGAVWDGYLKAWWPDGKGRVVPPAAYKEPHPDSRENAVAFIRRREAAIADALARGHDPAWAKLMGAARCDADDPFEKQVQDFIRSTPWAFRPKTDEDWWQGC